MTPDEYRQAQPFPHLIVDHFLDETLVRTAAEAFPSPDDTAWGRFDGSRERKLGNGHQVPTPVRVVLEHIAGCADWFTYLSGIENLVPDWTLGGGMHLVPPGGKLDMHVDFTRGIGELYRRMNALLFLNENWDPAWGGELFLGDKPIVPLFNRLVVFSTSDTSFHGHPEPLRCPSDRSRKSLACYFYAPTPPPGFVADHSTVFETA